MTDSVKMKSSIKHRPGIRIRSAANTVISALSGILAATLIVYGGYALYDNFYIQNQAFASSRAMLEYKPVILEDEEVPLAGSSLLTSINKDYRAWVTLDDTNIDYPVVQGPNDLYYASHDIYKETSLTGSIYLAADSSADLSDNYNIIYGHHMDNEAMFGGLDRYKDADYFKTHRSGSLIGGEKIYDLNVFAVISTDAYENIVYSTGNRDLSTIKEYVKMHSIQLDAETMDAAEKILVFSTCASAQTNGRLVILAAMTSDEEQGTTAAAVQEDPAENTPAGTDEIALNQTEETVIEEPQVPLARFTEVFRPSGSSFTGGSWALADLVSAVLTVYLLIPVLHLRDKYSRTRLMKNYRGEGSTLKKYNRRFMACISLEAMLAVAAVILFLLTEDMRNPMTLIDQWTLPHLVILAATAAADKHLLRGSRKDLARQADLLRAQA